MKNFSDDTKDNNMAKITENKFCTLTIALSTGLLSFLFYLYTLAPTVCWGDAAKLALFVHSGKPVFTSGGGHGLHTFIGIIFSRIFHQYELAYVLNIMSAFFSSASLILLFIIIYKQTRSYFIAASSSFILGISHTFWFVSVITESYTLMAFTFVLSLFMLLSWIENPHTWKIYILWIATFIGVLNHMLLIVFIPIILFFLIYIQKKEKRSLFEPLLVPSIACIVLVLFLWKNGVISELIETTTLHLTRFSDYSKFFKEAALYLFYLSYQYLFAVPFGIYGFYKLFKQDKTKTFLFVSLFVLDVSFASIYGKSRQFYLLIPSYIIFSIFIGIGLAFIKTKQKSALILIVTFLLISQVVVYYITPKILNHFGMKPVNGRNLTYRDPNLYFLWPSKRGYDGAYRFAKEALSEIEPNGVLLVDFTIQMPVAYLRTVKGYKTDITLFPTESISYMEPMQSWEKLKTVIDSHLKQNKSVYLADPDSIDFFTIHKGHFSCWQLLNENYQVTKKGIIYKIARKGSTKP